MHDEGFAAAVLALLVVANAALQRKAAAQTLKQPATDKKLDQFMLQVNTNEPAMMNLALNNATNVAQ